MKGSRASGFTLIELMMVVAILSILAAIAIPKFGNMVVKARESSLKGSLGAIRSGLSIYYADTEGGYPASGGLDTSLTGGQKYLKAIPSCQVPAPGNHPSTTGVTDYAGAYTDVGDWMYRSSSGTVTANCTHLDSNQRVWSTN